MLAASRPSLIFPRAPRVLGYPSHAMPFALRRTRQEAAGGWPPSFGTLSLRNVWGEDLGSTLWQDTAGTTPADDDAETVYRIDDAEGSDNLLRTTGTPTRATDGDGSHYVLKPASDTLMTVTFASAITTSQKVTLFFVFGLQATSGFSQIEMWRGSPGTSFCTGGPSSGALYIQGRRTGGGTVSIQAQGVDGNINGGAGDTDTHLLVVERPDSGKVRLYLDGTQFDGDALDADQAASWTATWLGDYHEGAHRMYAAGICNEVNATDRATLRTALQSVYPGLP